MLVIVVALVLVGTFDPLVGWLEHRGWGRGRALALIFLLAAVVLAAVIFLSIPPLIAQVQHIIEDAPAERRKARRVPQPVPMGGTVRQNDPRRPARRSRPQGGQSAARVLGGDPRRSSATRVTTLFLALYLLADPRRAKSLLYALVPRSYHVRLARILIELKTIVGGYMRGQLITSVAIAIFTFGAAHGSSASRTRSRSRCSPASPTSSRSSAATSPRAPVIFAVAPQGTARC